MNGDFTNAIARDRGALTARGLDYSDCSVGHHGLYDSDTGRTGEAYRYACGAVGTAGLPEQTAVGAIYSHFRHLFGRSNLTAAFAVEGHVEPGIFRSSVDHEILDARGGIVEFIDMSVFRTEFVGEAVVATVHRNEVAAPELLNLVVFSHRDAEGGEFQVAALGS